jgi:hypothetical protein
MAVKVQIKVFLIVMLHYVTVGYQCFEVPCCLHWYPNTTLHGIATQKTLTKMYVHVCVCACTCVKERERERSSSG